MIKRVLFLCTGNYYRSRFAEIFFNWHAEHIVAVKETEHRPLIQARFPTWLGRVEFWEVHDLDCVGPEIAIPHLEREVFSLIERLKT